MKRKILSVIGCLALGGIVLAGCSNNGERVETKNFYGMLGTGVSKLGTTDILFKKESTVPYINLEEGVELMSSVRSANLDDTKCKVTMKKENNEYVLSNETGAKCVVSPEKQTLTYDEYDKFSFISPADQGPLSLTYIKPREKSLKMTSCQYTKGNEVVIDLKPYSRLDIYERDGKCYLPLSTFNSAFFNTNTNVNLVYNGQAVFMVTGSALFEKNLLGETVLSEYGKKVHEDAEKGEISKEFSEYNYQSMCFEFNYNYGLKGKFTSFDEFVKKYSLYDSLTGTDPKDVDLSASILLSNLVDGHTNVSGYSYLYPMTEAKQDETKMNQTTIAWYNGDEAFKEQRQNTTGIKEGIQYFEDQKTVFVSFAKFEDLNDDLLYNTTSDKSADDDDFTGLDDDPGLDFGVSEELKMLDTGYLFKTLYSDLTGDLHKDTIKNVVVDLSANDGGSSDSLMYSLSTLIGEVTTDMVNPLSGAHNQQKYKADMNCDGVVDSNDKSLSELGFKIYFLNSKYSFSSANAMPVLAKLNNPNVITLGDKTAGGPCAVRYNISPIGTCFNSSSLSTISKLVDGKYVNIDDGVEADFKLTEAQMLNRQYIADNIKDWVK